jgi:hypothetical protein
VPAIEGLRAVYERGVQGRRVPQRARPGGPAHVDQRAERVQRGQPHTFSLIFQRDLDESPAPSWARRDSIIEMIVRFVRK